MRMYSLLQMPRRHCKMCGNPLHADDTHAECVSRLGQLKQDCFSLASLRSRLAFLFRERLRLSRGPTLVSLLPQSSYELTILWHAPHSSRMRPSASAALTSVNDAEEKGYEHLPHLNESVAAHIFPPTAIG